MHDTAFKIGKLFFDNYWQVNYHDILEIGSYDVGGYWSPGKLRDLAPQGSTFLGVDIAEGPNVDQVVTSSESLPFSNASFDVILASSVFEHDVAFWLTFLEMCRVVRPGGVIYINAPSNGSFHRYPVDNWRFYPDAGFALETWAKRNNQAVSLIESFVAEREADLWNDFCAVFAKSGEGEFAARGYISDQVECRNIRLNGQDDIIKFEPETEDMMLIRQHKSEIENLAALVPEHSLPLSVQDRAIANLARLTFANANLRNEIEMIMQEGSLSA